MRRTHSHLLPASALLVISSNALAFDVTCASVTPIGTSGNAPSVGASISADGRFVAFESGANSLTLGDTNDQYDVYVRDRLTGTTELITLNMQGGVAPFGGEQAVISADGRFVGFASWADDLVANDVNGWEDVFLRDRQSGVTECISVDTSGAPANRVSRDPAVSGDGRFVAFDSRASTLVATPDANLFLDDVFVRDRLAGTTEMVSTSTAGVQSDSVSTHPTLSADGRFVAFQSNGSNLVPNDTNGLSDIFVRDRVAGTTTRISVSSSGAQSDSENAKPAFSGDGRYVAFESLASNLAPGDTNGTWDIYVHDLVSGTTFRASVDSAGAQGMGHSFLPQLDHGGNYVVFESDDALDPFDTNGFLDVFLRDFASGTTRRVSTTDAGADILGTSFFPAISSDGSTVSFTTYVDGVVASDTNGVEDVFVNAWTADWTPMCFGDGSGTACPCGNASAVGAQAGCNHSGGVGGKLVGFGNPSLAQDTFALLGGAMPNGPALYVQGTAAAGGGTGFTFGDGLLCVSGAFTRLGVKFNSQGASRHPGAGDPSISVAGGCAVGVNAYYQSWYRDAATFCQTDTYNLTNAIVVTWKP